MNEYTIGYWAFFGLMGLALACLFYMLGGRRDIWLRRFIASAIASLTLWVTAIGMGQWSWWLLTVYPILAFAYTLGYGADDIWKKLWRRTLFAVAVTSAGLVCAIALGGKAWLVYPFHLGLGVFSVYLAVINPIYAPAEESFVCACLNAGLIAYPFIKG